MNQTVVDDLQQIFADAHTLEREDLAKIYANDVTFVDPLGRVEGLDQLSEYFEGVYKNVTSCRFDYLEECRLSNRTSIKWDMYFQHPKLSGGNEIKVRGVSLLEFNEKVTFHEDIYDVGALIYENVPVLGAPVRWLKRRAHRVSAGKQHPVK